MKVEHLAVSEKSKFHIAQLLKLHCKPLYTNTIIYDPLLAIDTILRHINAIKDYASKAQQAQLFSYITAITDYYLENECEITVNQKLKNYFREAL